MRTRTPLNAAQVVIACKCDRSSMMTVRPKVPTNIRENSGTVIQRLRED